MGEMVDKVAIALGNAELFDYRLSEPETLILARAAIEAMREPTESMIDASSEEGIEWNKDSRGYAANYYRAMIDAALKETA